MKFILLTLAAGVSAQLNVPTKVIRSGATPIERDVATISSVVAKAGANLAALDTAVKNFKVSDMTTVTNLENAAQQLSSGLTDGTAAIQASTNITLNDAITLQSQVTGLQTSGTSLVTDLVAKKVDIQTASLCDVVLKQVTTISTDANNLISAIVSKLPEAAQSIAQQQAAGFVTALQQTETTFAAGNCTNGATSTTGGSNGTTTGRPGASVTAGASAVGAAGSVGILVIAAVAALL